MAEATGCTCITILKWIWTQVKRRFSYMVENSQDNQVVVDMEASASLPSSSSAVLECKYDVFLSFRGPDTRKGITAQICNRLRRSSIITFMDELDLRVGDTISPTLIKAIKESRFAIIILSQNYASSTWCLEELREICQSMEDNRILPLFYHVDPTEVRYQKKGSFKEAFSKHETSGRHKRETVEEWRAALEKVANISGWNTNDFKTHSELVDKIVESVCSKVPLDPIESTGDFQPYEATKEAMHKVMEALRDDKITAVGVHGMGGVGKTSMVRHVAAQARKNGTFNSWIMAVVSQNFELEKIQGTLADLLGFKFVEETEDGRAARLHNEIMKKEKLLIIVDDVWERTELSKIGIPTYNELQKCKSKVLLTTRRLNVCNAMKCHEKISLKVLSDQDSWTLFVRNAGTISSSFEKVARRVASECKGLPIALIAVARALGDEDQEEWEKAAERLEQSQKVNPNHEEDAFRCIRLSYNYLKDGDSKSCFLLCCLFPEDDDIKIEDLFRYAIGKRLFRDAKTMEVARGRLVTVVKYLKNSSLLLESKKEGRVKMHDVIRDTAIQIAESEDCHRFLVEAGRGLKDWAPWGLHEGCTAISLMNNKILKLPEEELVCPNLQILLLNGNAELSEIPEKLIQNLKELRVLDLSNTSISILPQSFSLLTNLQALYLDDCGKLIDISVVGKLNKLEILSMRDCPRRKLSREIEHLTNLRILDVNRSWATSGMVKIPSKVISKLHKLEELYMVYCGYEDGRCVAEEPEEETNIIRFDELAGLSNLKILQVGLSDESFIPKNVEVAPDWDYFCITINGRCSSTTYMSAAYKQGDRNSRSLFLNGATLSTLPEWFIKAVTEKTEKLKYDRCGGMSDIVMEYDHGRLHKLKHLTVAGNLIDSYVYLKELMNTTRRVETGPVFENLEELHLIDLIHLEELCAGELPPGSLSNLKVLHMNGCFILKSVSEFVQRLPNLEKLDLNWMSEWEYVFRCEGFEPEQPKLREMHLLRLRALKSICNGPAPHAMFQSLKFLTIYDCDLLQSLFASDVAQCLVQLEHLVVEWCPLLERVMEAVNKEKTVLPKLKNLVLKELPLLYGPSATTVDIECPSLEHLIVVDCAHIPFSITHSLFRSFESRSRLSFSTSASDYFGSTYPIQLNDLQLYDLLRGSKVPLDPIESTGDFQAYEATKEAMRKVMEALRDDKITAVGVYGMGGVGKTSMVRHVAAQAWRNGTFNHWIMAVVSQNLDLEKIQGTLADLLGFKFVEETKVGRAARLHNEIMTKEKLLIIVDDVWERTELSKIGIPTYSELQKCKSKVLLTTRRLNVCNAMKCDEKISLKVLSDQDSWTLFVRNAGTIFFGSTSFEEVARRVASKCKGLPIALKVVARALRKGHSEKKCQRIEKSQSANLDHEEDTFECIKLSYDYLKDEEYKSFFLLCCLFPEDHHINIEDLFMYAIGIGLFRDVETIDEARGTAYTVVEHLKDSSLLLESDLPYGCVRMHDVVRDTALNIAKSEGGHRFLVKAGCGLDDWPPSRDEGCTAISLMHNPIRELPRHLVCPKLQILSLSHNNKLRVIPETFFQTLNELRVLDLSRTGISYLPQSFGLLTNLRALYLDGCWNLTDISVIGKIMMLEVLSVKGAPFMELSREIGNLTNLRVLDITDGYIGKIPSKLLSKLHSLEELYLQCDFGYWGSKVDGEGDETNSAFDEVTGLSKLRILHVWISNEECIPKLVELNPNWVGFFIRIGKDEEGLSDFYECYQDGDIDQRTIFLELDSISNFPDWFFNTVINKAETLWWYDCPRTGLIDVFVEYERGRLHSLKQLEVHGENNLYGTDDEDDLMNTSTWVPKKPLFENLEGLSLLHVELCAVEFLQPGSLCNLKLLNIESCYTWGDVLLPSTLLQRLPNLEELTCDTMDEIEYVFGYEAALLETEQSKLRKIGLSFLGRVRSLCEGPAPPAMFQNLQSLSITDCNLQGSLFTYDVAQCLSQLNFLGLHKCPLLERIVEASNKKIILPKLKHLRLWKLPVLYYESATFDIECPSLEELELWRCPKFSVSVPDFHSRKQIQLHEY